MARAGQSSHVICERMLAVPLAVRQGAVFVRHCVDQGPLVVRHAKQSQCLGTLVLVVTLQVCDTKRSDLQIQLNAKLGMHPGLKAQKCPSTSIRGQKRQGFGARAFAPIQRIKGTDTYQSSPCPLVLYRSDQSRYKRLCKC